MPNLVHVKRDYSQIFEKYIALGPNIENKMGAHGLAWDVSDEYQTLYGQNGTIDNPDFISHGRPSIYECKEACNAVLTLSSCTMVNWLFVLGRQWKKKLVFLILKRTQKVVNKKKLPLMTWFANHASSLAL